MAGVRRVGLLLLATTAARRVIGDDWIGFADRGPRRVIGGFFGVDDHVGFAHRRGQWLVDETLRAEDIVGAARGRGRRSIGVRRHSA